MVVRLALTIAILGAGEIANAQGTPTTPPTNASPKPFPTADFVLRDAPHKEPKSGVQFGPGGQLTIMSGVGTPTVINALTFSGDGKILAAGKDFGRVVLWDSSSRKFLRAIDTNQGNVNAIALSSDGKIVATGGSGDNYSVKTWDTSSGKLLWTFTEPRSPIQKALFDTEGQWLVVEDNSNVFIVNAGDQKATLKLPGIHAVCISQDGRSLVTTDGKEFGVWTAPEWKKTQSMPMSKSSSLLLAVNLGADQLALYESRSIRVAQFSTGQLALDRSDLVPKNFTWRPTFGEFSTEPGLLYLSLDGHLLVLDVKTNGVCGGPEMYSGAGALSRDGRWFAGSKDDSILSKERTDGVWVWSTDRLLDKCGFISPSNGRAQ